MTWQVASFVVLGLVLGGGAVWYERSKPPSKVVAMVAALAALAVAGRVALAPIPNVVATTDIVLLTGYAVGGAPGFAVGALAALVSNFWLGQGPWTPWQMAAWGLVGVGGAALARMTGRRLGRIGLAAWCGMAGLAYGALLDLSVMVTYGGEQSLDRYLALSARGVPFNVAHALGNIVFALIAGPALVRMLLRFRARMEVSWREPQQRPSGARTTGGAVAGALLAAIVLAAPVPGGGGSARAATPTSSSTWLAASQNPDGGFGAERGDDSSVAMTAWAALGLEGARRNPLDVARGATTPIDYLRENEDRIRATNDLERTILALEAAGVDARDFGGRDLIAELERSRRPDGSFRRWPNLTAFAILSLRATGIPCSRLERSAAWLRRAQNDDGGWGAVLGAASDADSTGAALQGLASCGGAVGASVADGVRYLRRGQRPDGGWALTDSGPSNSQSTAWAIQGLAAAGVDPSDVSAGGRSGLDFLGARQAGDGHYAYSSSSDQTPVWVTSQALLAASGTPFPLPAVARASAGASASSGSAGTAASGTAPAQSGGSAARSGSGSGGAGDSRPAAAGGGGNDAGGARSSPGDEPQAPAAVTTAEAAAAPVAQTSQPAPAGDDGGSWATVAAVFAAIALALGAGFVLHRRRLP